MNRETVFDVYQYAYGDREINRNFDELRSYVERYNLHLGRKEVLISGRACLDINSGNRLFAQDGTALVIKAIYAYGHVYKCLCAGMTCAVLADEANHSFFQFEKLYNKPCTDINEDFDLKEKHMQTIIIKLIPEKLTNPNLDLRYSLPTRIEEISNGTIQDNGYDYLNDQALGIWLQAESANQAYPIIINLLREEKMLNNDLSSCAEIYISENDSESIENCARVFPA